MCSCRWAWRTQEPPAPTVPLFTSGVASSETRHSIRRGFSFASDRRSLSGRKTARRRIRRAVSVQRGVLSFADVGGLQTLRTLRDFELDLVALGQALEALALDGVEMHEHVVARLVGDEPNGRWFEPSSKKPSVCRDE